MSHAEHNQRKGKKTWELLTKKTVIRAKMKKNRNFRHLSLTVSVCYALETSNMIFLLRVIKHCTLNQDSSPKIDHNVLIVSLA